MKSLMRSLRLLVLHNKQTLIHMRYDLGRELVVLISSLTLLGLFFYIFHDFLHQKLSDIPTATRGRLTEGFLVTLLCLMGPWIGGRVRSLWSGEASWATFGLRAGEEPGILTIYLTLQSALLLSLSYALYWLGIVPLFTETTLSHLWLWQTISLALAAARAWWLRPLAPDRNLELRPILSDRPSSRQLTLILWRWHQLTRRNRLSRLCLGLSLGILLLTIGLLASSWPFFLIVLLCMLCSLLLAAAVAFQLEDDMRAIWLERQMGCSHHEYVQVYQLLCWGLGVGLGGLGLLLALSVRPAEFVSWSEIWKTGPLIALFPAILPSVMFQLAPDRPILQIMVTALIGLFLGTALYAHGLALLLVPLFSYYAKQYQNENFYRS